MSRDNTIITKPVPLLPTHPPPQKMVMHSLEKTHLLYMYARVKLKFNLLAKIQDFKPD